MFKKYIEGISIFTLSLFIIQFTYLNSYYKMANVQIINFTDYIEILLVSSNWISIFIMFIPFSLFFIIDYNNSNLIKSFVILNDHKLINKRIITITLSIVCILLIYKMFINRLAILNNTSTITFFIIYLLITSFFLTYFEKLNLSYQNNLIIIYIIFISISCFSSSIFGIGDAVDKLSKRSNRKKVEFYYNNSFYKTNDTLIFWGETRSTLFLYTNKLKSTLIFPKTELKNLTYSK